MLDVKPVRDDASHAAALAEIDRLWDSAPGTPEADRLSVWVILVDAYEAERWPITPADPIDTIKAEMDMNGRTQADLAALIGSQSRASEILNRRRRLTVEMIHKLVDAWGLPADWLVRPYALEATQPTSRPSEARRQLWTRRKEADRTPPRPTACAAAGTRGRS